MDWKYYLTHPLDADGKNAIDNILLWGGVVNLHQTSYSNIYCKIHVDVHTGCNPSQTCNSYIHTSIFKGTVRMAVEIINICWHSFWTLLLQLHWIYIAALEPLLHESPLHTMSFKWPRSSDLGICIYIGLTCQCSSLNEKFLLLGGGVNSLVSNLLSWGHTVDLDFYGGSEYQSNLLTMKNSSFHMETGERALSIIYLSFEANS